MDIVSGKKKPTKLKLEVRDLVLSNSEAALFCIDVEWIAAYAAFCNDMIWNFKIAINGTLFFFFILIVSFEVLFTIVHFYKRTDD